MKLFKSVKKWFNDKYFVIFEIIALKSMLLTNYLLRKLILMKGKDPDYVPPPQPKIADVFGKPAPTSYSTGPQPAWVSAGAAAWVKKPGSHPVLETRRQFEVKKNAPVSQPVQEAVQALEVVRTLEAAQDAVKNHS